MLIFGGPGVGKTTVLKELSTMCKLAGMPLVSSAATGVAAGAMLDAGTNHSKYCLPVYANNETDPDDFLPPLSKKIINILMTEYEESLAAGTPLAIATRYLCWQHKRLEEYCEGSRNLNKITSKQNHLLLASSFS
jgi:hypothetical protein